ncbi:hypothetical protein BDZ94DRAFT_1300686 [Collybia nuda]|uniref:Uncharacterized protein n=1 Tax=Collybia nuda TaxID=64659 RepID=A0A9P5XYP5_9AGAR|nr:hypothetical protein BDZ94DRAFT_1300686 [Collybia nuda]
MWNKFVIAAGVLVTLVIRMVFRTRDHGRSRGAVRRGLIMDCGLWYVCETVDTAPAWATFASFHEAWKPPAAHAPASFEADPDPTKPEPQTTPNPTRPVLRWRSTALAFVFGLRAGAGVGDVGKTFPAVVENPCLARGTRKAVEVEVKSERSGTITSSEKHVAEPVHWWPEWCLDLTLTYELLRLGCWFEEMREFDIRKGLQNTELGWCGAVWLEGRGGGRVKVDRDRVHNQTIELFDPGNAPR